MHVQNAIIKNEITYMKTFQAFYLALLILFSFQATAFSDHVVKEKKVLICGVCRNVENAVENTIQNIEALGSHFADYAVIIYENNSTDNTVPKYQHWASVNPKVTFLTENVPVHQQPLSRTEKIARARNIVLAKARESQYTGFEYLIMVDLDFQSGWPINEILATIAKPVEWDCVSANGLLVDNVYMDIYALRNQDNPLGPEVLGDERFWRNHQTVKFSGDNWLPAYSAFGGLAIYKTSTLLRFNYSGIVTNDLATFYKYILISLPKTNYHLIRYLQLLKLKGPYHTDIRKVPIIFRSNMPAEHPQNYRPITCCEHVTLHASMAINGYGRFFINPKMVMQY